MGLKYSYNFKRSPNETQILLKYIVKLCKNCYLQKYLGIKQWTRWSSYVNKNKWNLYKKDRQDEYGPLRRQNVFHFSLILQENREKQES